MKSIELFATVLLIAGQFAADARAEDNGAPVAYRSVEDVVYGNKDGLALTLDVLTPAEHAKGIGLILVSSGSWKSGKSNIDAENARRRDQEHWVQGLLKSGYTVFVARHGSTPRYLVSEMIEDIRRSVRFARTHAERFQVDPQHLGITSGSSGGHLALMVALTGDDGKADAADPIERAGSRVQAVVAWFAPTDLVNWGRPDGYRTIEKLQPKLLPSILGAMNDVEGQLRAISPIYQVTSDDPPLLLIHGDRDATVPLQQSQLMKDKYEGVGLPVQLIVHKDGPHSYWPGIMDDYPAVWAWFDRHLARH